MFQQTFVSDEHGAKRPLGVLFSLSLQVGVVATLSLLPLMYVQPLPTAQLRWLITAPPPPSRPVPVLEGPAAGRTVSRVPPRPLLVAPAAVPHVLAPATDVPQVPEAPSLAAGLAPGSGAGYSNDLLTGSVPNPTALPPPVAPARAGNGPIRVGGSVAAANLIEQIQPVYPPLARSARIEGAVEFSAVIDKTGRVVNLRVVRGHPLLIPAAQAAILQWRYRPTSLNGQPVEVLTTITVNFRLQG